MNVQVTQKCGKLSLITLAVHSLLSALKYSSTKFLEEMLTKILNGNTFIDKENVAKKNSKHTGYLKKTLRR